MAPLSRDDAARLARGAAAGDPEAQDALCRWFLPPIRTKMLRHCGDPDLADDLAQQTLETLLLELGQEKLQQPESLVAYCHGIANNVWRKDLRERARLHQDTDFVEQAVDPLPSVEDLVTRDEEARLVRRLLDELPMARDRDVLRRYFLLGQDKAEICRALHLTPKNFDNVIHRAKLRLRALVRQSRG